MSNVTSEDEIKSEMRMGIANACIMLPRDPDMVRRALDLIDHRAAEEKEAVRDAKEQVNLKYAVGVVTENYGVRKPVLKFFQHLDKLPHGDCAFEIAQLARLLQIKGKLRKDLVEMAEEAALTTGDGIDQGSIFDSTTAAKRQGLDKAEPKPMKTKAEAPFGVPTPGIPLDEAERLFKEAEAEFGKKRKKPQAYLDAEATLKAALEADETPAEAKPAKAKRARPVLVDDDFSADAPPLRPENPFEGADGSGNYTVVA